MKKAGIAITTAALQGNLALAFTDIEMEAKI